MEKVAWAKKNGVKLPEYVLRAAEAESAEMVADAQKSSRKKCSCCSEANSDSAVEVCSEVCSDGSASSTSEASGCCASERGDEHQSDTVCRSETDRIPESTDDRASAASRYVIGIEMMKCRGQGLFWNSIPWAVIPIVHVPEFRVEPERWDRPQSAIAASQVADPPEPPPRLM